MKALRHLEKLMQIGRRVLGGHPSALLEDMRAQLIEEYSGTDKKPQGMHIDGITFDELKDRVFTPTYFAEYLVHNHGYLKECIERAEEAKHPLFVREDDNNEDVQRLLGYLVNTAVAFDQAKAIFKFDPTVSHALWESEMDTVHGSVFRRIPYFGLYIDLRPLAIYNQVAENLDGVFVNLAITPRPDLIDEEAEVDEKGLRKIPGAEALSLLYVGDGEVGAYPLILPLDVAVADVFTHEGLGGFESLDSHSQNEEDRELVSRTLSLLAYICSSEPDMRRVHRTKGSGKKRKKDNGKKSSRPRVYECGYRLGKNLRGVMSSSGHAKGTKRPHIRRAHWHTYWTGPRNSPNRIASVKWIPPTVVAGKAKDIKAVTLHVNEKSRDGLPQEEAS